MGADDTDEEEIIGFDSIEPGLPPASSDRQKWWLENKKPARAEVEAPKVKDGQAVILNPRRPSNPFAQTDEPDWVTIPRSSSRQSLSSLSSSPFEHVSLPIMLSGSSSGPAPRRLPPPFDPSSVLSKPSRHTVHEDQGAKTQKNEPPPPPPPRRQTAVVTAPHQGTNAGPKKAQPAPPQPPRPSSAISQLSQGSKTGKPPPVVAKKPPHLTTAASPTGSPQIGGVASLAKPADSPSARPPLPRRSSTGPQNVSSRPEPTSAFKIPSPESDGKRFDGPPKPPRRIATTNGDDGGKQALRGGGAVALTGMVPTNSGKPAVPSKPKIPAQKKAPVDLLDDLDDGGAGDMGSWATLKPSSQY
jgi:synaptojanin